MSISYCYLLVNALEAVVSCIYIGSSCQLSLAYFFQYALVKFGICVGLVLCGYRG